MINFQSINVTFYKKSAFIPIYVTLSMDVKYKEVETIPEFIDAIRLRVDVFMIAQKFEAGWEPDEDDKVSRHFIAIVDGNVVEQFQQNIEFVEQFTVQQFQQWTGLFNNSTDFVRGF